MRGRRYAPRITSAWHFNEQTGEWRATCYTCNEEIFTPKRKDMGKTMLYHTRKVCTGGY